MASGVTGAAGVGSWLRLHSATRAWGAHTRDPAFQSPGRRSRWAMSATGADEAKRLNQGLRDADHFRVRRRAEAVDRRHLVSIAVVLSGTDTFTELYGGSHGRAVITMGACARAGGQKKAVPSWREVALWPAWKVCDHAVTGTRCSLFGQLARRRSWRHPLRRRM